MNLGPSRVQNK